MGSGMRFRRPHLAPLAGAPAHGRTMPARPVEPGARRLSDLGRVRFAIAFAIVTALAASAFGVVFSDTVHVRAPATEVAIAIFVAGLGIAVVPVTQLLVRDPSGVSTALTPRGVLPLVVALLSVASGVIHFASIDQQSGGYWLYYVLFAGLSIFQLGWAMLVFVRPSRSVYVAGALVNAGAVGVWAVSRTVGVPFGRMAGEVESLAFADVTATVLEILLVVGVVALVALRAQRPPRGAAAATASFLLAQLLLAPTALALISTVGTHLLVSPSD
jgi:hypothetical protein